MLRFVLGVVVAVIASTVSAAEEADLVDLSDGLSLVEAETISLTESPRIALAGSGEDAAETRLRQAQMRWVPRVSVSETFTRSNNPVFVFGSLLEQGEFAAEHFDPAFLNDPDDFDNYRTAVTASLPLFDQLRRWSSISQARLGVEASEAQSELARQLLRYHTIRSYYGVLVAEARKEVANESVAVAESNVKNIRDRVETGLLVESDQLAAEVQLAEFLQQQVNAEGELVIARKRLSAVMGLALDTRYTLDGVLVPQSFPQIDAPQLLSTGLTNRPDIRMAEINAQQAALGKRIAAGQFLPRVDAFASWGASGATLSDQDDDHAVGLVVSWNLLDPGRFFRVGEARAGELAAAASHQQTLVDAELDIESSYQRYLTAGKRVLVGEKAVGQSLESLRIVRDRYDEGLTTITEVLRAQAAAAQARYSYLAALFDHHSGYADLLRASGTLTSVELLATNHTEPARNDNEPTE